MLLQNGLVFFISEGDALQFNDKVPSEGFRSFSGIGGRIGLPAFLLQKKLVHPMNAGCGRLDGLNFHADVLNRTENLGNICGHGHCGSGGHSKEFQKLRVLRGSKQHHQSDKHRLKNLNDRRVNGIKEVGAVHRREAFLDGLVVVLLQIGFFSERMDGADAVQGFGNNGRSSGNCGTVVNLSAEHSFLYEPCECKEYGNGKKKQDCQTAAFLKNHDEDSDHGAAVGKHAGNSIREELLDGVGISDKAG